MTIVTAPTGIARAATPPTFPTRLSSDDAGLLYYNTAQKRLFMWTGTAWSRVGRGSDTTHATSLTTPQGEWITPTLQNNWVRYDTTYPAPGYMKDDFNVVHLDGMVRSGTINAAMFTLPVGYRPTNVQLLTTMSNAALGRIDVSTAGAVTCVSGNNTWVSLCGLSFRAS